MKRLSEECVRASWEAVRDDMRQYLLNDLEFNPRSVKRAIDNFINSMVFAQIPNTSPPGIKRAFEVYQHETAN